MSNYQHLNNKSHQDIKVQTKHSALLGDAIASCLTFPTEFGDVQSEYPILFRKDPQTDEFCSIAVFGFEQGENLFLQNEQWQANYIPAAVKKGPFLIGFQNKTQQGGNVEEAVINIDLNNPRINKAEGEAIFLSDGSPSSYTEQMNSLLHAIHQGIEFSTAMFSAFSEFELIEPVTVDIELDNGQKLQLQDNYTIHEETLANLDGKALEELNKAGFLQAAFLVVASLNNIKKLVELKNKKIS